MTTSDESNLEGQQQQQAEPERTRGGLVISPEALERIRYARESQKIRTKGGKEYVCYHCRTRVTALERPPCCPSCGGLSDERPRK